jgi:ABC-type uncharacterized transport system substrate-binding protein
VFSDAVMAGLVPAIHAFLAAGKQGVDARDKRGHDGHVGVFPIPNSAPFRAMNHPMKSRIAAFLAATLGTLALTAPALAHPHVWITMKSELVYAPDGTVTGIRHAWAFDDMFSTFALQGLESKQKGVFTRDELKPLAEVNVTSLKEYGYFTYAKANGKKSDLTDPVDYWLDYKDQILTLNFTLPFKAPVKARDLDLEVYDPSYFIDFALAEKDPVTLAGAPAGCKLALAKAGEVTVEQGKKFSEADFTALANNYGAQYANKISVKCP